MNWLDEIKRASKHEKNWRDKARKIVDRYVDERDREETSTKFNILWSNTETLRPALISATPRPEVRPRYKKKDPLARVSAKIAERGLEFQTDIFDFVSYGKKLVQDYLLPGRAVTRIRYIPTFEKREEKIPLKMVERGGVTHFERDGKAVDEFEIGDDGPFVREMVEELVYEEVRPERVPWQWFRMEPCEKWEDCNWVAFGSAYSEDEGVEEFGEQFRKAQAPSEDTDEEMRGKTVVWEIWDKRVRKQIFVAEGQQKPLEENDDPLGLEGFFPMPEPVYIIENNDTMVPTPEFVLWQDQADELDQLSQRIARVTEAIKARGAYPGNENKTLSDILTSDDNTLVPVDDWAAFIDKGGLDGMISWIPIEQFAKVLQILEQQRAVKIQEIFELTGVSDILRGATDPRETAKAQQLKANFGNRRLTTKQNDIQTHFRNVYRLMVEIMAERFDPETLKMMIGLESDNELFDEALELLKSDALRAFNIDIETDSTIAIDEQKEKEGLAEAMQATANFVGSMFPLVQAGAVPPQVAFEILRDYFRKFRFGRKLDELLEDFQQNQPPNPEKEEKDAEQQQKQAEFQMEMQKMQAELQKKQRESEIKIAELEAKMRLEAQKASQELRQDEEEHNQELRQDAEMHEQKLRNERQLAQQKANEE